MSFTDAVSTCLRKYATFSGRARRSEYWWFVLAFVLAVAVASVIDQITWGVPALSVLVLLALALPSLAANIRRLHDTGRSGAWYLISFIPFGGLVLLVFECMDSTPGANQYGPSPKYPVPSASVYA